MKNIYYVGIIDWDLRNFHGYSTHRGSTYNSYIVVDEKVALIDNVKAPFVEEFLANIKEAIGDRKIDYLISNHLEGDHSGTLPVLKDIYPNAQIVTSKRGKDMFLRYYKKNWDIKAVSTSDTISLGKKTLTFVEIPMVHWPDSMVTYCSPNNILFSNDAFGQHIATSKRFDYENDLTEILEEAKKYYANIVMHLSGIIKKVLKTVTEELKLQIDMICPSHGVVWKDHISEILKHYVSWSNGETIEKVLIIYDTMWHSTELMASAMLKGIQDESVLVKMFRITNSDLSDIITETLDARGILIGSPTINNGMFPTVGGFLTYFKGLRPPTKIVGVFGSYGWNAKNTMDQMTANLKEARIPEILDPITTNFVPDPEELEKFREFGKEFAKKIKS
ncbi:MAG: FprA family A-type flavoprotein [Candidatus Lokiarchaeota archaeon]|nr:FprA family A-type flavoprotein [Candidatus Lokiarchaeota archaeon]